MINRRPVHPESPRTASFGPEQRTHTKHTMNTGTPTDYYMQNKPNFQKSQMNVSIFSQKAYENINDWTLGENKPNQTQFQCQLCENKPKSNPISAQKRGQQTQSNPISPPPLGAFEPVFRKGEKQYVKKHCCLNGCSGGIVLLL